MNVIKENDSINAWLSVLEPMKADEKKAKLARRLYQLAALPKRKRVSVNLTKLEAHTKENDNVLVPGKVLGAGSITKKLNIAAISYSKDASEKLKAAKCTTSKLEEMLKNKDFKIII